MKQTRFFVLLALFVLSACPALAQSGLTNEGTDFWLAFMPNYLSPADAIRLYLTSSTNSLVRIDALADSTQSFTKLVSASTGLTFTFPNSSLVEERLQETPQYKAIHVYSNNPIALYGLSTVLTTTDSYLALPSSALGQDYYVSCMYDDNFAELGLPDPLAGEFVVIASADNTEVTIGPVRAHTRSDPSGTVSHNIGATWKVTLQKGQTYLVQSTGLKPGEEDLTGTHITSTKPIGVICGHQRCRVPVDGHANSKDMVMEMMLPTDRWGTEYFELPQAGRIICGDNVRIIAGEDNCNITENGNTVAQFNKAGDWVDRELVVDPAHYTSNGKKFMIVSYSYSQNFNGDPIQSDPFSVLMTPRQLFEKRMLFRVPNNPGTSGEYTNYATFICKTDSIHKIRINGKFITAYELAGQGDFPKLSPPMSAYCFKIPDANQTYLATCGEPFACYIYGRSNVESYGHPAGMALNVSSSDVLPPAQSSVQYANGVFNLCYLDNASRIATLGLVTDSNDSRWSKPSYNFALHFPSADPLSGPDSAGFAQVCFQLKVRDSIRDGYAAVWVTDRAGNDTVYEYSYKGIPKGLLVAQPATYAFGTVDTGQTKSNTFTITNIGTAADSIAAFALTDPLSAYTFSTSATPTILQPNDSLHLTVTFAPHLAGYLPGALVKTEADGASDTLIRFSGIGHYPDQQPNEVVATDNMRGIQFTVVPNPSHGAASCYITLDQPEALRLVAIDALGRTVFAENMGMLGAGEHHLDLPSSLSDGTYFIRLISASGAIEKKLVMIR